MDRSELIEYLYKELLRRGHDSSEYKERLKLEIKECFKIDALDYFADLYDNDYKYSENENNLLIPYLLGIVDSFNITEGPKWEYGDLPDVDVDYIDVVRDYLKDEWAPKVFGEENVCSIGNYSTFGIKNSLIDMTRVFGESRDTILSITTQLGTRDDEGNILTWEGALSSSQKLKEFCEAHHEIADAAKRLVGRSRGKGKHAGGLIISSSPIDKLVPLVTDDKGNPVSAWTEGLHSQDLQPVGLVKYDLLSITNLIQIAKIVALVKKRHNIDSICAKEGLSDWSDISYLNDEKALELASQGKLKGIFQFDSPGIREMVRKGGVNSFDDLAAYTALYRPGPLNSGMHEKYIARKLGKEQYELHPVLEPILSDTYGNMIYQEQVMKILNAVGKIPLKDCEIVRKAISKKKESVFAKYKEMFIKNGQEVLGWGESEVQELWDQIASFAEYGFNKSHAVGYTYISSRLLYLKAHYPLEFFTGILELEQDENKIMEYKLDAEKSGIKINRVDLNKSGITFSIAENDEIYMGFSNIKDIGPGPAAEIVKHQPYSSFVDFLQKFGTDARILKQLITLGLFPECHDGSIQGNPREVLYEYYLYYKDYTKKIEDRKTRNQNSLNGRVEELQYLFVQAAMNIDATHEFFLDNLHYDNELDFEEYLEREWPPGLESSSVWPLLKKYKRSKLDYEKKVAKDKLIYLKDFEPKGKIDNKLKEIFSHDLLTAELLCYGFGWEHMLTKSPDYEGDWTFSEFDKHYEDGSIVRCVECQIIEPPKKKQSKKGKPYYVLKVEDAEWRQAGVTVWEEDYERFQEEFEYWESDVGRGNLCKMRLTYPTAPFPNYTFESPMKHLRHKEIPADKNKDHRLMVMARS